MENTGEAYKHDSEQWGPSHIFEGSQGTQFIEANSFEPMEMHNMANFYPHLRLKPTSQVNYSLYEENCAYRREELFKFRLIEGFSDGLVYTGDSFGRQSYIDAGEPRGCSALCLCNQHDETPEAFAFIAYKSLGQLDIAVHSSDLYSELINAVGLEEMYVEGRDQENILDGLALLKNYSTLKAHLYAIQSDPLALGSLVLEMELLVHGFLADGEVFKSYGYEDLYEDGILTYDHWKEVQQAQLEKKILALEQSYYEIDNDHEFESLTSLAQADRLGQEAEEAQSTDIFISDQPIAEFESVPDLMSTSDGQPFPPRPKDKQSIDWSKKSRLLDMYRDKNAFPGLCPKEVDFRSQLLAAIKGGEESLVQMLLDEKADANGGRDCNYFWPKYPRAFTDIYSFNVVVRMGTPYRSPLAEAAKAGHETLIRLLLDRGANLASSCKGLYSYHLLNLVDAVKLLAIALDHGYESQIQSCLYHESNHRKSVLLAEAARKGHEGLVRILLDQGAPIINVWSPYTPFIYGPLDGSWYDYSVIPLIESVLAGHRSVVRLLRTRGADLMATALGIKKHSCVECMIRFLQNPVLQDAPNSDIGDACPLQVLQDAPDSDIGDACPLQYYLKRRQRLHILHEKFGKQHFQLRLATTQSLTSFQNLSETLRDHRKAWAYGIKTLRRLCNGEAPHSLAHTISFLCLSKAISETLDTNGACKYGNQFFQDLDRWQILFASNVTSLDAYKEAVQLMWGIELPQKVDHSDKACQLETLIYFQNLASTLASQTRELFTCSRDPSGTGLEPSQECWRRRISQHPLNSETTYKFSGAQNSGGTSTQVFMVKDPKPPDPQPPGPQPPDPQHSDPQPPNPRLPDPQPPNPEPQQKESNLRKQVNSDTSSARMDPIVALLMAGAIFAIVLLFLKWLQDTSSRANYYSAMAVSRSDLQAQQIDVKHAVNSIINMLQQTAPTITRAISKLKDHLGQVLKLGRISCFSMLKEVLVGCTSSSILGCSETETMGIQQMIQQICDYYEPVYALQERYRNLEAYMGLRDRIVVVPTPPAPSIPVATSDVASIRHQSQKPEAQSPSRGSSYISPSFCRDCQRDFRSISNYNKHRRDKHGGARYCCRYCTKSFSRNSYKDAHEKKEHTGFMR